MKLDILVFAAHPDDAELNAGGTISALVSRGNKVGIIDFRPLYLSIIEIFTSCFHHSWLSLYEDRLPVTDFIFITIK